MTWRDIRLLRAFVSYHVGRKPEAIRKAMQRLSFKSTFEGFSKYIDRIGKKDAV